MRIGIMISPSHAIPPQEKIILAPWMVVHYLTEGLVATGRHQVYLFAAVGSQTSAHLYDFDIQPTGRIKVKVSDEVYRERRRIDEKSLFEHMIEIAQREHIDIIHLHQAINMAPLIGDAPKNIPFVITLHDPMVGRRRDAVIELNSYGNCSFVSISNAQRDNLSIHYAGTVYNGIQTEEFLYDEHGGEYLLIAGRITPEKGTAHAIQVSLDLNKKLYVVGEPIVDTEKSRSYWYDMVRPYIDGKKIGYIGFIEKNNLRTLYQKAKALLVPIEWEEPFGLTMIESMACGTPVVAYGRGSVPEVIRDGTTGFIVNPSDTDIRGDWIVKKTGQEGMKEAIEKIYAMPIDQYQSMRRACRARVEKLFTVETMVENYEKIYEKILSGSFPRTRESRVLQTGSPIGSGMTER